MKIKKFNENYDDSNYDYSDFIKPITFESVKESIIKALSNYEVDNSKMEKDVEQLAKRIMFKFNENLNYMSENYEDELEKIATGEFK